MRSKFNALRKCGANTAAMAQTTAAATMTYGVETCGIADTMLRSMRAATAKICAGTASGKSTDRTLYAVDGSRSTIDPAFAAHANPITMWAHAWWSNWADEKEMRLTFEGATTELQRAKKSKWARVTGPAAAVKATAERLGWQWHSASEVTDDVGRKWSFLDDSPAAVKKGVRQSVRRWRLERIAKQFKGTIPERGDIGSGDPNGTRVVDCAAAALSALGKAKTASEKNDGWKPAYRASLTSATAGG
jgi:hypothetical protein